MMRSAAGDLANNNSSVSGEDSSTVLLDPKKPLLIDIDIAIGHFVLSSVSIPRSLMKDTHFEFLKHDDNLIL